MNKKNEMMNYIWLLNAADNSAFEVKELYEEFKERQTDFIAALREFSISDEKRTYLQQEIYSNLDSLAGLQKTLQEVTHILNRAQKELSCDGK